MFSKACEYGIKAAIFIASQSSLNKRASLKEVASEIDSPEAFTAKILQRLARNGILESNIGPTGGYSIEKKRIKKIMLNEIVDAIDGNSIYISCGLGLNKCNAKIPCPVHDKFSVIREELRKMLMTTGLLELSNELKMQHSVLMR
ncbi:RrF2 family transcriptional regulator [uncultured Croceitalea sp.]|uniref:RrF2 family transcriptional regulator n=1 Tax=uncultured Croceitalea sp. TaxID=1798908 RepID=UPI00374E6F17